MVNISDIRRLLLKSTSIVLLLMLPIISHVTADCNVCTVGTKRACVSETEYRECSDGTPFGAIIKCGLNAVCTVFGSCEEQAATTIVSCSMSDCQICDSTKTFGCLNSHEFALCLGTDNLSPIEGTCEPDYVCNIYNSKICGEPENFPATCPYTSDPITTTSTTTTTPSPSLDPNAFCKVMNSEGRYPVGINPETTCKQYLQCFEHNNEWIGVFYYCSGSTYFDSVSGRCSNELPSRCSQRVERLKLFDFQLY